MEQEIDHLADEPRVLRVFDLAQSHAKEIRALTQAVKNVQKNRNAGQSVPHYMRRRAASHNANRLPRSVRKVFEKYVPNKVKRPSRYYRRRPKNLLDEYAKRQRRVHWLETHIWHSKRFHMKESWGYKLPNYPTEKGERSAHRAATQHCLIQDQSYINCIDVRTRGCRLLPVLKSLTSEAEYGADMQRYSRGLEVLECTLYHPGQYPAGAVCPLQILFNAKPEDGWSQAWIWCHTLALPSVWSILCKAFSIEDCLEQKLSQSEDVVLTNLREELVRFKLIGKQTFETLTRAIFPTNTDPLAGDHVWWKGEHANSNGEITSNLKAALEKIDRCNGNVATVRARDPRLCMPSIICDMRERKREKEKQESKVREELVAGCMHCHVTDDSEDKSGGDLRANEEATSLNTNNIAKIEAAQSALWSASVRERVSGHIMSQHEINRRQSELLVPGSKAFLGVNESCIPLVLILRPSRADVILPARWAMAFWIAFVYSGARSGGLREDKVACTCTNELHFPTDFPDTELCQQEDLNSAKEMKIKHFKYPPNKRPNFDKLRTNSPFGCDWSSVLSMGSPIVLRDKRVLESLLMPPTASIDLPEELSQVNLVRVALRIVHRGTLQPRAEICLLSPEDTEQLRLGSRVGPMIEPNKTKANRSDITHATLPTDRIQSSREVVGFVTAGLYSLKEGTVCGHGFVTLQSLLLFKRSAGRMVCIVRAADSRQYSFAYLRVLSPKSY